MIESTASRAEQNLQTPDEHPLEPKLRGEQIEHVSENTRSGVVLQTAGTSWFNSPSRNQVQATPGSPIPQGHPGDVTVVVTDLVESASVGGTDAEQSVLVEPRAVAADGTDDVRPSLVEPATPDGTGAERSVLVESREVTDGTGVELSMLVESDGTDVERSALVESCAVVGGTDVDRSPGGHGGGGGQSLGTPGSVVRPHELEQAELVARDVITDYVKPALLVGGAGARVGGGVGGSAAEPPGGASCAS